ncbi:hypothetical protein [Aporhodopirellula aestuarii]|uniref:Transmembrane protein n=1 Tax=Aporhodopirellula aestuarii TaxID=2950107 RepID=A0ABT0U1U5_9BACT|nr:hypothetical protein [Aporhodopirellula aestuarii]MCM2370861.1 hypothetical protein [Aporhodopirellula aestuarii]
MRPHKASPLIEPEPINKYRYVESTAECVCMMNGSVTTSSDWNGLIDDAIRTGDPWVSNFKITRVHWLLSNALAEELGDNVGANFHSWAIWGSRKAGVTIRQADRDQASRDATIVAGIVGGLVGVATGWGMSRATSIGLPTSLAIWVLTGIVCGGISGWFLARYTRVRAAKLILQGNRIVLDDIGRVTASYLDFLRRGREDTGDNNGDNASAAEFAKWRASLRPGKSEDDGQDLLGRAFACYEAARTSNDLKTKHEQAYFGNCLAVLHEHYRLQPIIARSLPFLISRCVTQRLMTYSVGETQLAVHDDVPPLSETPFPPTLIDIDSTELRVFLHGDSGWDVGRDQLINTKANDWRDLHQRMGYIVNLFRTRHLSPDVVASPYDDEQLSDIANGKLPQQPW